MSSRSDAETLNTERFTKRLQKPINPSQRGLAIALWVVTAAVTLILGRGVSAEQRSGLLFFILLHGLSVLLSVRLPAGAYVGLINTSMTAASLVIGYRYAMLVPLLASLIAAPFALGLIAAFRNLRRYRETMFYETVWHSATASISLLPAGWLYERFGGALITARFPTDVAVAFVLSISVYFAVTLAFKLIWMVLGDLKPGSYWQRYWVLLVASDLVAPLALTSLIATRFHVQDTLRLLGLLPYAVGALIVRSVTRTQLNLTDRIADLRALNSIGQTLNATLELDDLLEAIYTEISKLLDTSGFYLALYDQAEHTIQYVSNYEASQPLQPQTLPFANGLTEHIILTRKPLLLTHNVADQTQQLGLEPVSRPVMSYLGAPLIAGDEELGVIALRNYEREYAYDEDDLRLLETIASSAAVALQNARLYKQSQRQASELTSINQVSTLVSASLDLSTAIKRICQVVAQVMQCEKTAIFLVDTESRLYRLAGSTGFSRAFREQSAIIDANHSARARVLRTRTAIVCEDVRTAPDFAGVRDLLEAENVRAVLDVPLRIGDEVIGSLAAYYRRPRRFEDSEIEVMHTLAAQVSIAVDNARLFETMTNHHREVEALYNTARAINASLSLPSVLRAVANSMIDVLKVDACIMLLAENEGKALHAELWMERSKRGIVERPNHVTFQLDDLVGLRDTIHSQESIELYREPPDPEHSACKLVVHYDLETALALPLIRQGSLFGLIVVGYRNRMAEFGRDFARLARALADQAAVALQNARLFEHTDVALSRRLDELGALEMISQRMTRRLDLQAVIDQVVAAASIATGAEASELFLLDENRNLLIVAARRGIFQDTSATEWPAHMGMVGRALRTGLVQMAGNVAEDPDYIATRDNIQSELAVPIIIDQRRLGLINLESVRPYAFDEDQVRFITNLAEHAAIAIQNAQLFETVQKRADEFQTLRAIALDLLNSTNLKHTLQVIVREALERTGAADVHVYLYDQANERLTFGTSLWANGDVDREFARPRPNGLTATAARTGERLVIANPGEHPLIKDMIHQPDWEPIQAMISVPLKQGDEVVGVFNIAFDDRTLLNNGTLHFLDLLAAQAAVAIQNARLAELTRLGRDRLQAILNSIHDGILMFDMHGRLVMANPRVEVLIGQPIGEYSGKHFRWLAQHMEREYGEENFSTREIFDMVRQIRAVPDMVTRRTYSLLTPSLHVIEEISIAVVGDGQPIGRLFILRDITREHEAEMYRQELSHMIVHDLRSPLGGVITGLNMAIEETKRIIQDQHAEMIDATLQVALTSANSLLRLVEEILEVNTLEAGEVPLDREPLDLKSLATRTRDLLRGTAAEGDIRISVRGQDNLPPVNADADKIGRVFVNLVDNALRYTPQGGQVMIDITQANGYQVVSITDTGEGIPPEQRERVFERFFQGDPSRRKRGSKGSGLGLTFCKLAIEAHGGRIWVDEGPEGGASFHFTLPTMPSST